MATSDGGPVDPADEALNRLEEARTALQSMDSKYAAVYDAMAEQLGEFVKADRDGELEEVEQMLEQLRAAWEAEQSEDSA